MDCQNSVIITSSINEKLEGNFIISLYKDDSCVPSNMEIYGIFIVQSRYGSTNLSLSGYVSILEYNLVYLNTSLSIIHDTMGGTQHLSFVTLKVNSLIAVSTIRITGTLKGDSGYDLIPDTEVGLIICTVK